MKKIIKIMKWKIQNTKDIILNEKNVVYAILEDYCNSVYTDLDGFSARIDKNIEQDVLIYSFIISTSIEYKLFDVHFFSKSLNIFTVKLILYARLPINNKSFYCNDINNFKQTLDELIAGAEVNEILIYLQEKLG